MMFSETILFLVFGCWLQTDFVATAQNVSDCAHNKADIIFLLDSSYSEGVDNFKKQLDFVKNFTQAYDIGRDKVQIGLVTFSSSPHTAFYLNQHLTKASVQAALKTVSYIPGGTTTDKALQYVRDNSFLAVHGGRYGVPKIVVVLTDGQSSNPTATASQAHVLHFAGIKVIAIGIGSGVKSAEINSIASDQQHAFMVNSFNSLRTIERDIQGAACTSEKIESCDNKKADIIFILDGSGSEGITNFQKQLQFVANFTEKFDIGPNNIQIGVVTFGTHYHNEFYLNTYSNKTQLVNAIRHVKYISGTTNTAEALQFVRQHGFSPENGGRGNSISQLVVVLTDGRSNSNSQTVTQAVYLHQAGIKVISIGIGSSVSTSELSSIATDPQHSFTVANFNSLSSVQDQIERAACTTPHVCGSHPSDIVFVLDSSTSVGQVHFQKQLDFVTKFVEDFDVGKSGVQFGLVTYSDTAHNEFYFNSYRDKYSLMAAIQSVQYRSGTTATDQGIRNARYYQFSRYHGGRVNASLAMIVLTDGRSNDLTKTLTEAQYLKNAGVTIVAVGIGPSVNQYEINSIATDRNHAFMVGSFDILHTMLDDIEAKACGSTVPEPTAFPDCGNDPADIVFLLDSSASEGASNFQKQVDFVRDFSYQFQIGPKDVQISLVTFSTRVTEVFPLNKYHDQASLLKALSHVTYISGATYTDVALKYARTQSFLSNKGGRHVERVVIVVTDGQSTFPNKTQTEASLLKKISNVTVVAIGVGSGVGRAELSHIATNSKHTFTVPSFDALQIVKSELTFVTCKSCEFLTKADIAFVVDSSASVGSDNFKKQLDFISRVVNDLDIGRQAIQVGMVTFSDSAHLEFYLNKYSSSKTTLLSSIQRIGYRSGVITRTDLGLQFTRLHMFSQTYGGRSGVAHYVILLTDGPASSHTKALVEANNLKANNARVITVGIGSKVNKAELSAMASDQNQVLLATDFDTLQNLRTDLMATACKELLTTTPVPTTTTTITTTTTTPMTTPTTTTPYLTLWP